MAFAENSVMNKPDTFILLRIGHFHVALTSVYMSVEIRKDFLYPFLESSVQESPFWEREKNCMSWKMNFPLRLTHAVYSAASIPGSAADSVWSSARFYEPVPLDVGLPLADRRIYIHQNDLAKLKGGLPWG
jgi:hypothetical protein